MKEIQNSDRTDMSFEEAIERLSQITVQMENASLPLASLKTLYQEGRALHDYCRKVLDETEKEMIVLTEKDGV